MNIPVVGAVDTPKATLFDYENVIHLVSMSMSGSVTELGRDVCEACVENPDMADTGSVQFNAMFSFDGGSVGGAVHAQHCDSLDADAR